jgi:hypothetical protein
MTDILTVAVLGTIESDREMAERALEIVRATPAARFRFQTAEAIGNDICIAIGERLSDRFDGAVPKDEIHDCLWMTFTGAVNWADIGRYYLEDQEVL